MRYLAEATWYPTALLPSQGVRWQAVDASSAKATLKDSDTEVSLVFHFKEAGVIDSFRTEARGHARPMKGEVAWAMPEGVKPYYRGRVQSLSYEFIN